MAQLLQLCHKAESTEQLKKVFDLLFTLEEKETLSSRCLIIMALLEKQRPQREIAEKLQVSIAQITRGSNALKIIDADLESFLTAYLKLDFLNS